MFEGPGGLWAALCPPLSWQKRRGRPWVAGVWVEGVNRGAAGGGRGAEGAPRLGGPLVGRAGSEGPLGGDGGEVSKGTLDWIPPTRGGWAGLLGVEEAKEETPGWWGRISEKEIGGPRAGGVGGCWQGWGWVTPRLLGEAKRGTPGWWGWEGGTQAGGGGWRDRFGGAGSGWGQGEKDLSLPHCPQQAGEEVLPPLDAANFSLFFLWCFHLRGASRYPVLPQRGPRVAQGQENPPGSLPPADPPHPHGN